MKKEIGQKSFNIWFLGDSNPKNWGNKLHHPFDARHPIRHNIITSIFDIIQDKVYLSEKLRIDTNAIFIRNAIENPEFRPKRYDQNWSTQINNELLLYKKAIIKYKPKFIFSFGAFSFEFLRRCWENSELRSYSYWDTKRLGMQFRDRTSNIEITKTNIIPLLHRSIAAGKFLESHKYFCGNQNANYFYETGNVLSAIFLKYKETLNIWYK